MRKVAIIIPTWENLRFLKQAIGSVRDLTPPESYRLIVISNGCKDGTVEWCRSQSVEVVDLEDNLGHAKALNIGLDMSRDCDFLRMDDDVRVSDPGWLQRMQSRFEDLEIGSVGPISNFVMGTQDHRRQGLPMLHDTPFLVGFCNLVRKEAMDKIGYMDTQFGHASDDLSLEVRKLGYRIVVDRTVFVHHFGAMGSNRLGGYDKILEEAKPKFAAKWGADYWQNMSDELNAICSGGEDPRSLLKTQYVTSDGRILAEQGHINRIGEII